MTCKIIALTTVISLFLVISCDSWAATARWEFNDVQEAKGWNLHGLETKGTTDGVWKLTATLGTPQMFTTPTDIDAANQQIVTFRMKLGKGIVTGGCLLFIADTFPKWDDATVVNFQCHSDGQFHDYEVDMSKNPLWKGTVQQLRFQPIYVAWPIPDEQRGIEIDYFRVPDLRDQQEGKAVALELIQNGDAERLDNKGNPIGWKKFCEDPLPIDVTEMRLFGNPANSLISNEAHTGKNSLWINIPPGKQQIGGWAVRTEMKPKTLYEFTCWAKTEGKVFGGVAFNEFKEGGVRTAQHVLVVDSPQWKKFTLEFESDPETVWIQVVPHIWESTGQAWFDDLRLRVPDFSAVPSEAREKDETPFSRLTNEVVTPHLRWGVPLTSGPIKLLAIPTHREIVELAQRLSIDYTTWRRFEDTDKTPGGEVMDVIYYGPRKRGTLASLAELKAKIGMQQDVILFGGCYWKGACLSDWQTLPEQLKSDMLGKVKQGAGIIFIRPSRDARLDPFMETPLPVPPYLSVGIPFDGLPVLDLDARGDKWLKCFTCGKGRVAIVDFQNEQFGFFEVERAFRRGIESPFTPDVTYDYRASPLHYEYYQSLLAKLVVWAGQKEGTVAFSSLRFEDGKVLARISNTGAQQEVTVEIIVKDAEGTMEARRETKVGIRNGETDFQQPTTGIKSGAHFGDVWLKKGGKTLVWGSVYFQTQSAVEIAGIETSSFSYNPGETVEGRVTFSQVLPETSKVKFQLLDSLGRIVAQKETTSAGGRELTFQLPLLDPVAIHHTLKASLMGAENAVLSQKSAVVLCRREPVDDFQCWFWAPSANNTVTSRYMLRSMHDRGFDVAYISLLYPQPAEQITGMYLNMVKPNLDLALYTTGALAISGGGYDRNDTVRPRCLTSEAFRANLFDELRQHATVARDFPVLAYSLGDEIGIGMCEQDFCFSPTCLGYTRNYLKSAYGDLSKLNAEWGTTFASWDEVKPMTRQEAKQRDNFAPWADHRMAMEDMYATLFRECAEVIGKQDPRVRLGAEGITGGGMYEMNGEDSSVGYDFGKIIPQQKMWGVYFQHYPQIEFLRSFASPGSSLFTYTQPFEEYPGGYYEDKWQNEKVNRFVPWYDLFHGFNAVQYWDSMDTNWYGFYSRDLRTTPWAEQITETVREIKRGVGKLLLKCRRENNGIALHYSAASSHAETILGGRERVESPRAFCNLLEDLGLQYDFISKEQLAQGKLGNYKVLILAYSRAISDEEAQAIKAFAARGGTVIADGEAGVMDGHCKYVKQNMLSGVKLVSAGNPIWKYREVRNSDTGRNYRSQMRDLLSKGGIKPRFRIVPKNSTELVGVELVEFTNGNAHYLGILQGREHLKKEKENHTPQPVKIQLPQKYHVYSVRDSRYLGFVDAIETGIEPAVAKLYALLPCAVKAIELKGLREKYGPGAEVKYELVVKPTPGIAVPRVFHVEVQRPDGSIYREYTRNVYAPDVKGHGSFRLALNDLKGMWLIVVKDVSSGTEVGQRFKVQM